MDKTEWGLFGHAVLVGLRRTVRGGRHLQHLHHCEIKSRALAMQYAFVNGKRNEAFPGAKGVCPTCGAEMVAKCGPRVIHHWAHRARRNCDPWWENETDWHREWKSQFPEDCREIHHQAEDGEIHRADIMTPTGIYIEVQHSALAEAERQARETFYENVLWIIDGKGFCRNFDVYHKLPYPNSAVAEDIIWFKTHRSLGGTKRGLFYRLSETQRFHPDTALTKANVGPLLTSRGELVQVHSYREIVDEIDKTYRGHHQFDWVRPRQIWLDTQFPVFIDFGEDRLVKLEAYDSSGLTCIRYVTKQQLVRDSMLKLDAREVCAIDDL